MLATRFSQARIIQSSKTEMRKLLTHGATSIIITVSATAGIAQLVERNLAKVEVASSNLVSRSKFLGKAFMLSLNFS